MSSSALKEGKLSLYLVLPTHHMDTYSRWLRLVVVCALNEMVRAPRSPTEHPAGNDRGRVLFLLDEFGSSGGWIRSCEPCAPSRLRHSILAVLAGPLPGQGDLPRSVADLPRQRRRLADVREKRPRLLAAPLRAHRRGDDLRRDRRREAKLEPRAAYFALGGPVAKLRRARGGGSCRTRCSECRERSSPLS